MAQCDDGVRLARQGGTRFDWRRGRAALRQLPQSLRKLSRARPPLGCSFHGSRDILAKQIVIDGAVPTRCERLGQIADDHLVKHHAECVRVCAGRRRFSFYDFRRHVKTCAGLRRVTRMVCQSADSDSGSTKSRFISQNTDAKIAQPHPQCPVGLAVDEDVGRFDVLVKNPDRVGRRQRYGDLPDDLDTIAERSRGEAALFSEPLLEIDATGKL